MKNIKLSLVLVAVLGAGQLVVAQGKQSELKTDTAHVDMQNVSKHLYELKDSINIGITSLLKKNETAKGTARKKITKAIGELTSYRNELQKVIDEVAATSVSKWDANIRERAVRTTRNTRREFKRIQEDVKGAVSTNS